MAEETRKVYRIYWPEAETDTIDVFNGRVVYATGACNRYLYDMFMDISQQIEVEGGRVVPVEPTSAPRRVCPRIGCAE